MNATMRRRLFAITLTMLTLAVTGLGATPPTLQEMVRLVAQLGGYVNRKRRDEPGPQTVWLGLQRVHDIANCWLIFGPEAKNDELLV